jgi:Na+/citrate or Na+/malate symporter
MQIGMLGLEIGEKLPGMNTRIGSSATLGFYRVPKGR